MTDTPDVLKRILTRKAEEIAERSQRQPLNRLRGLAEAGSPVRGFEQSMRGRLADGRPAVIAEAKKASPSKGLLRADFSPSAIARDYEAAGAACLSVLTDKDFFQGSEDYLVEARGACQLPVLRKDFTIDPYQVYEARAIGADCILLIVAALGDVDLRDLGLLAMELGMDVLIEAHSREELERALELPFGILGINNRNLRNFDTRLETTLDLLHMIPKDRLVVTESGIRTPDDVSRMRAAGVHAFLIGEAFMRASSPGAELRALFESPTRAASH